MSMQVNFTKAQDITEQVDFMSTLDELKGVSV
jgi:hypothetical protein